MYKTDILYIGYLLRNTKHSFVEFKCKYCDLYVIQPKNCDNIMIHFQQRYQMPPLQSSIWNWFYGAPTQLRHIAPNRKDDLG